MQIPRRRSQDVKKQLAKKIKEKTWTFSNSFLKLLFDICGHWFSLSHSFLGKKLKLLGHKMYFLKV